MNWEAVTALSTLFTGIVFLITVLVGARQLVQLRKATQLEGTMKLAEKIGDRNYQNGLRFVRYELESRLKDADFRRDWEAGSILGMDPAKHPEFHVIMLHELIGTYVKEGLIQGSTIYELCGTRITMSWEKLKPLVLGARKKFGDEAWENFEFLSEEAQRWYDAKRKKSAKKPARRGGG